MKNAISAKQLNNSIAVPVVFEDWCQDMLSDPITKKSVKLGHFKMVNGLLDARVFLRNTCGYDSWQVGQIEFEQWESSGEGRDRLLQYLNEIDYDSEIYRYYNLDGTILDCGGGICTTRNFIDSNTRIISLDPYVNVHMEVPALKYEAYPCLKNPLNLIAGNAEFLPFLDNVFDWVQMRSMLDHVQVPDLAIIEARRVLKPNGSLLIGMFIEGGRPGSFNFKNKAKKIVKSLLSYTGVKAFKDYHVFHPTYSALNKLITDNGFEVVDEYWQPFY